MDWLRKFMYGRYGADQLNLTLLAVIPVLYILNLFLRSRVLLIICWIPIFLYMFRSFSRNIAARSAENSKFLDIVRPLRQWWRKKTNTRKDMKTHKYYKCPNCQQKIRVPKGKGKICITCPKCRMDFIKRT